MFVAVTTFAAAAALLILVPGPDNTLVIRNALRYGRPVGVRTAAGTLTGVLIWVAAAALGLSALLATSRVGYDALRYAGAAYLAWLGIASLRSAGKASVDINVDLGGSRWSHSGRVGYLTGVATNLANPKVGVFFVAFLPAFIPHGSPVGLTSLLLGVVFAIEAGLWFAVLLWLVGRATAWLRRPRVQRRLEQISGVVLVGFAVRLATERR